MPDFTHEEVLQVLDYDPETGDFRWKVRTGGMRAGTSALRPHSAGYYTIYIFGYPKLAHRLAWFMHYGVWPEFEIDHINRDKSDTRISNLREANRSQNGINGPLRTTNTSGVIGVTWDKHRLKWVAQIAIGNRALHLGRYETKEEAIAARKAGEERHHGEFTPRNLHG